MNPRDPGADKLLLSKAYDALELYERRGVPRFTSFLNEHESAFLRANISESRGAVFYGGHPSAERLMMGAGACEEDFPITALEFAYRPEFELSHRDFLGALMALGVRRDVIGDILVGSGRTVVFFADEIVPYILSNVEKVGRVGVRLSYADPSDLPEGDKAEESTLTLSSLRLDAFVAAVCKLSRDKAANLIKSDMVAVDHVIENGVAFNLHEGSVVTVRKYGKFIISELRGETRKGKLRITVKHYG